MKYSKESLEKIRTEVVATIIALESRKAETAKVDRKHLISLLEIMRDVIDDVR